MNEHALPPPAIPPASSPICCPASTPRWPTSSSRSLTSTARARYRSLGFANLFEYLHRELGLSRGAAHYRKVAARLVARFPEMVEPLRDGRLCLSSVLALAKVITEANRHEVLPRFFHRSREEAKQVAVEIAPVGRGAPEDGRHRAGRAGARCAVPVNSGTSPFNPGELAAVPEKPRTLVEPLTATGARIHLTVSPGPAPKLRKARAGQSHVQPGATDEQVIDGGAGSAHRAAGEAAGQRSPEGEAGGDEARRGEVHVAARERRRVRFDRAAGGGSRGPAREGRGVHGRQLRILCHRTTWKPRAGPTATR